MDSTLNFRCRAFDTRHFPPEIRLDAPATFFDGSGPESIEKVTGWSECRIVDWLVAERSARGLLLEELGLPVDTYIQTNVRRPLIERNRSNPPGDIDLVLVPHPRRAIAIQVKRVRVIADTMDSDITLGDYEGDIARLIQQANGSVEIGFHADYAMVLVECCGVRRSENNFLFRNATQDVFRKRVYHVTKCQPIHPNVGIIFFEVTQPTKAGHGEAGMVSVCEDKRAARREQKTELTERVYRLMQYKPSI